MENIDFSQFMSARPELFLFLGFIAWLIRGGVKLCKELLPTIKSYFEKSLANKQSQLDCLLDIKNSVKGIDRLMTKDDIINIFMNGGIIPSSNSNPPTPILNGSGTITKQVL